MLALIDADIVAYRVGFTTNNEDLQIAHFRVDEMMDNILVETKADSWQAWLSDIAENNYRFKLCKTYKATRKAEKPVHHEAIKEYLITKWKARIASMMEADDALGIAQEKDGNLGTCICSIDKDLLMIPGWNYNFVKKEMKFVTPEQGRIAFYTQLLVGDVSDNIQGCRGIGPVKAARALEGLSTERDLYTRVFDTYKAQGMKEEDMLLAGRLLKIRMIEDEPLWNFPSMSVAHEFP